MASQRSNQGWAAEIASSAGGVHLAWTTSWICRRTGRGSHLAQRRYFVVVAW
jgi:hypothetical protein